MLNIRNINVYDLEESVVASRNAMRTEQFIYENHEQLEREFVESLDRACKLVAHSANDDHVKCHDNFLTGIRVSFDLVYPQYITPELQRYHWVDIVTSASKMHRLPKMHIDKCCNKYVHQENIERTEKDVAAYNDILKLKAEGTFRKWTFFLRETADADSHIIVDTDADEALYHARIIALSNLPMGFELFERCSTNYKQLQTIYWQRHDHRLKEDWGAFCEFIKQLPYADLFITGEHNRYIKK